MEFIGIAEDVRMTEAGMYAEIIRNMQVGIHIYRLEDIDDDRSFRMIASNPAAFEYTGVAMQNELGNSLDENFPDLRESGILQKFADIVRSGKQEMLEEFCCKDNQNPKGKVLCKAFLLPDNCIGVAFENIKEQKRVEEKLIRREKMYRSLFENMQAGFALHQMLFDEAGKPTDFVFLDINKSFEKILGKPREDLLGKKVSEVFPGIEHDSADWIGTYGKVVKTDASLSFENYSEALRKWYSVVAYSQGNDRFAVVCLDISEHKLAQLALQEAHAKLEQRVEERTRELKETNQQLLHEIQERKQIEESLRQKKFIIDSSSSAIATSALDGDMTYANPAFMKMWRYEQIAEFKGRHFREFWLVDDRLDEIMHALGTQGVWSSELKAKRKDGTLFDVQVSAATVFDSEGRPVALTSTSIDITKNKKAELDRLHLERQILKAQKLESLGVLAGGVAHEYNNLLTSVLGNAELALMSLSSEAPERTHLHDIEAAAQKLADLAKQMLAYSGKGQFVVEEVNLSNLVGDMESLLHASLSKKVEIQYQLESDLPLIEADTGQISQVIVNLVSNASEACFKKGGIVSLCTGVVNANRKYLLDNNLAGELEEGNYVFLEVFDTGCGMDQPTKERVFEPFFSTKFTGRGLGLAAVLGIVRGHRGVIRIRSEKGQGSTFLVLFPLSKRAQGSATESLYREKSWSSGRTILLVDDEKAVQSVGKQMLMKLGFTVMIANNGKEAVDIVRQRSDEIDAVILDLTMPELDGAQAFAEIMRIRDDLPVVLSSGYTEQYATQQFAGKGLAGFLSKPYRSRTLAQKLREVLLLKDQGV